MPNDRAVKYSSARLASWIFAARSPDYTMRIKLIAKTSSPPRTRGSRRSVVLDFRMRAGTTEYVEFSSPD
jgi:hypothetical protein